MGEVSRVKEEEEEEEEDEEMFKNSLLETRQPFRCQRCGGQLLHCDDEFSCLQCSAPHTKDGELAIYTVQEFYLKRGLSRSRANKRNIDNRYIRMYR